MGRVNLLGQAYTTKNPYVHSDTCINYYPESICKEDNSLQTQKQQPSVVLYPTPGYSVAWSLGSPAAILAAQAAVAAAQSNVTVATNAVTAATAVVSTDQASINSIETSLVTSSNILPLTTSLGLVVTTTLAIGFYNQVQFYVGELTGVPITLGSIVSIQSSILSNLNSMVAAQAPVSDISMPSTQVQIATGTLVNNLQNSPSLLAALAQLSADTIILATANSNLSAAEITLAAAQATLTAALTPGSIRGLLYYNGFVYAVSNSTFFVLSPAAGNTLTTVHTFNSLTTSTGAVSIISNGNIGNQLLICDGVHKYYYNIQTNTLGTVTDPAGVVTTQAAYQQGYGVMANAGTNQFYITNLEDFSVINALNFASAYTKPDPLVTVATLKQYLILFTQTGGEIWQNVGTTTINGVTTTFPYSNLTSSYLEQGCAAPFSVTLSVNTLYWLTRNERGHGQIARIGGGGLIVLSPEIISTRPIENFLSSLSTLSDCIAYSYQQGGHEFVVFTFPTGNATIVFDVTETLWHFRSSTGTSTLGRDSGSCYANGNGIHYVGDCNTQTIYYIDPANLVTTSVTATVPLTYRERTTQHICMDNTRVSISRLEVDIMSLSGYSTTSLPTLDLQVSRDGGHTFVDFGSRSFGYDTTKNVETRVYWTLLGMSRNWVFRFSSTSQVDYVIMGVMADTEDEEQDSGGQS